MIAKLALKLKATQKTQTKESPAYDSDKLSNTKVQHEFTMQLTNRFESMALDLDNAVSVEKTWTALKETYNQVAKETIGHKKRPKDEWLSGQTWTLIEERRKLKHCLLDGGDNSDTVLKNQLYQDQDKLVKKSARGDKRNFLEKKAAMAEEAAKRGDSRAVYRITNEIIGKRRNLNGPVKDVNGKTVSAPDEISEVWALHFEKVLNRPSPPDTADIPTTPFLELQINTAEPSTEELTQAARKLKNGRVPGSNRI